SRGSSACWRGARAVSARSTREDARAPVLDERGEAPVQADVVAVGEGVDEDGDAGILLREQDGWPRYEQRREQDSQDADHGGTHGHSGIAVTPNIRPRAPARRGSRSRRGCRTPGRMERAHAPTVDRDRAREPLSATR